MVIKRMKKNMGTYVALNIGLKLAKGNYFCVLGSDDIYIPEKLQIQVDEFTQNPNYICVVGNYIRKNISSSEIFVTIFFNKFRQNIMENGIMGECTSMYSMSIINKIGYYDCVRYGADTNFFWRIK